MVLMNNENYTDRIPNSSKIKLADSRMKGIKNKNHQILFSFPHFHSLKSWAQHIVHEHMCTIWWCWYERRIEHSTFHGTIFIACWQVHRDVLWIHNFITWKRVKRQRHWNACFSYGLHAYLTVQPNSHTQEKVAWTACSQVTHWDDMFVYMFVHQVKNICGYGYRTYVYW